MSGQAPERGRQGEAFAGLQAASHPVSHTPAVARPELGSVIVLALQQDTPEESARELADTLAALNQGVAVITVRGVDALRTWEPEPQPAPEPDAAADALAAAREHVAWIWRNAPDETVRGKADQALHQLTAGGVTAPGREPGETP